MKKNSLVIPAQHILTTGISGQGFNGKTVCNYCESETFKVIHTLNPSSYRLG